jgi:hypothetical protein
VAATSVSIHFAVQSMVWLAHHNHAITLKPAQSVLTMKDLYGKALYEILDAVAILKIPATIGWEDPIPDPAAWGGAIFLLLKLVVIVLLAGISSRLWRATRKLRWNHRRQGDVFVDDDGDGAGPPRVETAELARNDPGAQMPEPAERIDAESDRRLKQSVPHCARDVFGDHEKLVDQQTELVEDLVALDFGAAADRLGGLQVEPALEDGESAEEVAFGIGEQRV